MRIGVISDIHANLYALMEAFTELEREGVDNIICIGNIVGYGPHPNEVVSFLRRKKILALQGDHDLSVINPSKSIIDENTMNNFSLEFTSRELTKNNLYYLSNLPKEITCKFQDLNIKFSHKDPYNNNFSIMEEDVLIYGGTHTPRNENVGRGKAIINPGSVGKPLSGNSHVTFGYIDIIGNIYKFHTLTIEYSFVKLQKDMKMMNFPEILINSYETGVY